MINYPKYNQLVLTQNDTKSILNQPQIASIKKSRNIITGLKKEWIEILFRITIFKIAIKNYRNPWHWIYVPLRLDKKRRKAIGEHRLFKLIHLNNRYYWGLYTPGWNGNSFQNFIASEMNRIIPMKKKVNQFINAYVSITKKCSLRCEHCYEWENLNTKDNLSTEVIVSNITKIQQKGVSQIHLTGGEPLLRIAAILEILEHCDKKNTDFWVLTSGFKLTDENAKNLHLGGLTGVFISLDHFDPEKHNTFRGYKDAFYWAKEGVKNAINNNLVVALSICVTNEFTSTENLISYAKLAKEWGVSFIQLLEPKEVGHYTDKNVVLSNEKTALLDDFYFNMNYNSDNKSFPLISYHGYYQRRQGCYASGNRSFYLDANGDFNSCPFCHQKSGSIFNDNFDDCITDMISKGCPNYTQIKT
ncbi:radical SAM protein [Flavobacterium orientale]|uniref:Radical SAM core domain-containing protein n=1 Tax=Flavobacterium orientale TaxID=1756020 RepID=A0A916XW60_9FLAO|nr:radical SAM protein [Flavobacterium orientale]GGD15683.1 hypothetical protein GCM10011343_03300 [Flavobacterium orientale]